MKLIKLIWRYLNKKTNSKLYIFIRFILRKLILISINLLWLIEPFYKIRIHRGQESRIGHLAMYFEVMIRTKEININNKNVHDIFIIKNTKKHKVIANKVLYEMWKKHIHFIESDFLAFLYHIACPVIVNKRHFPPYKIELGAILYDKPTLSFSSDQIEKGKSICNKLGINNDEWFVCLHNREATFLADVISNDANHKHNIRDCQFQNFFKAAEVINLRGGKSIRMYSGDKSPLKESNKLKIIDYSYTSRSEFMDIYLSGNCKFFLGCTSGLINVAKIFNIPCAVTNSFPVNENAVPSNSLFIPKLIWSKKENRGLSMKEIIALGAHKVYFVKDLDNLGLEIRENDSDDIALLTEDMFDLINNIVVSEKENLLRIKFMKKYFKQNQHVNKFNYENSFDNAGKISWRFLQKHSYLMKD